MRKKLEIRILFHPPQLRLLLQDGRIRKQNYSSDLLDWGAAASRVICLPRHHKLNGRVYMLIYLSAQLHSPVLPPTNMGTRPSCPREHPLRRQSLQHSLGTPISFPRYSSLDPLRSDAFRRPSSRVRNNVRLRPTRNNAPLRPQFWLHEYHGRNDPTHFPLLTSLVRESLRTCTSKLQHARQPRRSRPRGYYARHGSVHEQFHG
jgi:hypothetical protein